MTALLAVAITVADLAAAIPRMVSVGQWTAPQFRREAGQHRALALAIVFHREAEAAGLDPLLVAAVAANESGFYMRPPKRNGGGVGDVGILQIRQAYAASVCGAAPTTSPAPRTRRSSTATRPGPRGRR